MLDMNTKHLAQGQTQEVFMDIRYSANQKDVKRYTTQELRDEFLITGLYTGFGQFFNRVNSSPEM
mgnify:CR=1 FL=1